MLQAVIFDIDGVLLDSFEANFRFYQNLMTRAGYRPPTLAEFRPLFHLPMYEGIKIMTKSIVENEIKRIWEMGRSREVPYPMELATTPAGAEETIIALSHTYPLAIVTSRVHEAVYEAPALVKLQKYFQVAVAYQDTTEHKPHPAPLLFAAQRLGIPPQHSVYIGDVETDVQAARAAKMKVIIYAKEQLKNADAWTPSFTQLPELIQLL